MKEKEKIVNKLLKKKAITKKEAEVLLEEDNKSVQYVPYVPYSPPEPFKKFEPGDVPYEDIPLPFSQRDIWVDDEYSRRLAQIQNCGCNPLNGGSGICNCTLSSPIITYCSINQVNSVLPKNHTN